jgi:hypothetical protein
MEYFDMPEGDTGIAAKYPGDKGIANDPDVAFADDFESYENEKQLLPHWSTMLDGPGDNRGKFSITREPGNFFHGKQALEMKLEPKPIEHQIGISKIFTEEEYDTFHVRWYQMFGKDTFIKGPSHNGCGVSGHYFDPKFGNGPLNKGSWAGLPSDGYNKFTCCIDFGKHPAPGNFYHTESPIGKVFVYMYHPKQYYGYGDHCYPTGYVYPPSDRDKLRKGDWGPDFKERPDFEPEAGKWYCYEIMVKCNSVVDTGAPTGLPGHDMDNPTGKPMTTKGINDGRVTFWVDGKVVLDFPNVLLRHREDLKIENVGIGFQTQGNCHDGDAYKFIDHVVMGKSYIGPLVK